MADKYGRRNCILLDAVVCIVGSVIVSFSYNYIQLMLGRFVIGITSGASTGVASVYLNEISPVHLRGTIGTFIQLVLVFAVFLSELLGGIWRTDPWLWRVGCMIPAVLCGIQLGVGYFFLPSSPQWRASMGDIEGARDVLENTFGRKSTAHLELAEFLDKNKDLATETDKGQENESNKDNNETSQQNSENEKSTDGDKDTTDENNNNAGGDAIVTSNTNTNAGNEETAVLVDSDQFAGSRSGTRRSTMKFDSELGVIEACKKYPVIKRVFFISLFVHILQQLSGIDVIFYYSTHLLNESGLEANSAFWGSIAIAFANFAFVLVATYAIEKGGRRPLFMASSICMIFACLILTGMFFGLEEDEPGSPIHTVFSIGTVGTLIFFVIGFELGLGPITWLFVAEITPIEYRGRFTSIAQMVNYSCNALIALTATSMIEGLENFSFIPFAIICAIGTVVTYKYLPETRNKTVQKILEEI